MAASRARASRAADHRRASAGRAAALRQPENRGTQALVEHGRTPHQRAVGVEREELVADQVAVVVVRTQDEHADVGIERVDALLEAQQSLVRPVAGDASVHHLERLAAQRLELFTEAHHEGLLLRHVLGQDEGVAGHDDAPRAMHRVERGPAVAVGPDRRHDARAAHHRRHQQHAARVRPRVVQQLVVQGEDQPLDRMVARNPRVGADQRDHRRAGGDGEPRKEPPAAAALQSMWATTRSSPICSDSAMRRATLPKTFS